MNLIFTSIALAATAGFAYPPGSQDSYQQVYQTNFNLEIGGIFTIPRVWPSGGTDSKLGLGLRVLPAAEFPLTDHFLVRGIVGYEFTTWGYQFQDATGYAEDVSVQTHFLALGLAGQYHLIGRPTFVSVGFSADIPLRSDLVDEVNYGDGTLDSYEGRFHGDQTALMLDLGLGHQITPMIALVVGYRFPMTPYYDKDGLILGLHQFNLGLRLSLL